MQVFAVLIIVALFVALVDRQGRVDQLKQRVHRARVESHVRLQRSTQLRLKLHELSKTIYRERQASAAQQRLAREAQAEYRQEIEELDRRLGELKQELAEAQKKYAAERSLARRSPTCWTKTRG